MDRVGARANAIAVAPSEPYPASVIARGRVWGGLATLLLGVGLAVSAGTAAWSAEASPAYVAPIWVEYCSGCVGLVSANGAPTSIPFGAIVSNSAAVAVRVTVDTAGLDASKVQVVGVTGVVTFSVAPRQPGAAPCPGNDQVSYEVDLGEALRSRALVDGQCLPSGQASNTSFCFPDSTRFRP
jgi:hypothetical protein